jgi:hypothetical protein
LLINRDEGGRWVGFYYKAPTIEEVREKVTDQHSFLNFDDDAVAPKSGLRDFLAERFPDRCRFESDMPDSFLSGGATQDADRIFGALAGR